MKRIGIRKLVGKAVDTKVGTGTDAAISAIAKKTTDAISFVGRKSGLNKIKADVPGKGARKKANLLVRDKTNQTERNIVEQDARDIQAGKDWEKEKQEMDDYIANSNPDRIPVDDVHVPKEGGRL